VAACSPCNLRKGRPSAARDRHDPDARSRSSPRCMTCRTMAGCSRRTTCTRAGWTFCTGIRSWSRDARREFGEGQRRAPCAMTLDQAPASDSAMHNPGDAHRHIPCPPGTAPECAPGTAAQLTGWTCAELAQEVLDGLRGRAAAAGAGGRALPEAILDACMVDARSRRPPPWRCANSDEGQRCCQPRMALPEDDARMALRLRAGP
jgi:hypothetical protein